jgi:hypothetical protein
MRKVMGNELEVYLFSFKLLQVQYFSQKWHITENLERWNLGKINENKVSGKWTTAPLKRRPSKDRKTHWRMKYFVVGVTRRQW